VDTRKTYPVPTGLGHAISYLPAGMVTAADEAHYRASHGAGVRSRTRGGGGDGRTATMRANGDEDVYRLGTSRLTPKQAYEQGPKQ
jgi:hypothetical protein